MTKEDYIKLHGLLSDIQDEYRSEYYDMKNGKNKIIRNKAERNVSLLIDRAFWWIKRYPKSFDLMISEDATPMDKTIVWDEFRTSTWFSKDMDELLEHTDNKIKSMK